MSVATGGAATGMPGLPEVWQWEEQLVGLGTRYTGSSGHAAYVDWLAGQLSAVPGFTMRTDRLTFSRWLARDFALTVSVPASVGRSGPVPLTYYFGEGSSLYAAGLGTVSLCPMPTYLLQAGDAQQPRLLDLDKLDQRLMYGQILAAAQTVETLDAAPATVL